MSRLVSRSWVFALLVLACAALLSVPSRAAVYYWDTGTVAGYRPGDGNWTSDAFWTTSGTTLAAWPGGTTHGAVFSAVGTSTITVDADVTLGDNFQVGGASGSTVIINQSAGTVAHRVSWKTRSIGDVAGSTATYNLSGGTLAIGPDSSRGTFLIGNNGSGTVNISGTGAMTVFSNFSIGQNSGVGVVNQTGGTFSYSAGGGDTGMWIGGTTYNTTSTVWNDNQYNLSGGTATFNSYGLWIAGSGKGSLNISGTGAWNQGGNNTVVGGVAGSTGYLNVSGGSFTSTSGVTLSSASTVGVINQTGGTISFGGNLTVGGLATIIGNSTTGITNSFGNLARSGGGTLVVTPYNGSLDTNEKIKFNSNPASTNGIVGGWVFGQVSNSDSTGYFLTTAADSGKYRLTAFSAYAGANGDIDFASPGATKNENIAGSPAAIDSATVNSLLVSGTATINSSHTLTVGTGGIILNGGTIAGGSLAVSTSAAEIYTGTGSASTISSNITGTGGLVKRGPSLLVLAGDNSGLTGSVTLGEGTLRLGSANAYSPTSKLVLAPGTTLQLGGNSLSIAASNLVLAGMEQVIENAHPTAVSFTVTGADSIAYGGVFRDGVGSPTSGTLEFIKDGSGTITFRPTVAQGYTGGTTIKSGTLVLDFSSAGTASSLLAATSPLTMGGSALMALQPVLQIKPLNTAITQGFGSLTLNQGQAVIQKVTGGTGGVTLNLGNISRDTGGGVIDFGNNGGATITTTKTNTNSILGPWAIYTSGTTYLWAKGSADGSATAIQALPSGSDDGRVSAAGSGAATKNYFCDADTSLGANFTANTIRYSLDAVEITQDASRFVYVNGIIARGTNQFITGTVKPASGTEIVAWAPNSSNNDKLNFACTVDASDGTTRGTLTVAGSGVVTIGRGSGTGTLANTTDVVVAGSGTFGFSKNTTLTTYNGNITTNSAGTVLIAGASNVALGGTINAGTLKIGDNTADNPTLAINGSATASTLDFYRDGSGAQKSFLTINNGGSLNVSGPITTRGSNAYQVTLNTGGSLTAGYWELTANGNSVPSLFTQNGGNATVNAMRIGREGPNGRGTINLSGGMLTLNATNATTMPNGNMPAGAALVFGYTGGTGNLNISGGTMTVNGDFNTMGTNTDVTANVNLSGGILDMAGFSMNKTSSGSGKLLLNLNGSSGTSGFTGGTLRNPSNVTAAGDVTQNATSNNSLLDITGANTTIGTNWTAAVSSGINAATVSVGSGRTLTMATGKTLSIGSQGRLTGAGTVTGGNGTALSAGGSILPGGTGTAGTLTLNSALALNGGTLAFDLASVNTVGGGVNDYLSVGATPTFGGTNTISVAALGSSLYEGDYTLIHAPGGLGGADFSLGSNTSIVVGGFTYNLSLTNSTATDEILTVTPASTTTATKYTLAAGANATTIHVAGSTAITATITNTGTGTADTLDYSGLTVTPSGGTVTGSATNGGPLANSGGADTNSGLSFSSATPGTFTLTPVVGSTTNHTIGNGGGAPTLDGTPTTVSVKVFSGSAKWTSTAGASWNTGANWTDGSVSDIHVVPGSFAGFTTTDTATFDGSGSISAIQLDVSPSLKSLHFSGATAYSLAPAPSTNNSVTMNADTGAATIAADAIGGAANHTVSAKVYTAVGGSDLSVSVAGGAGLDLSGGIDNAAGNDVTLTQAGSGTLKTGNIVNNTGTVLVSAGTVQVDGSISGSGSTTINGSLTADSIVQTTLSIGAGGSVTISETTTGAGGASAVPEPGTWVLLATGALLAIIARKRRQGGANRHS